MIDHKRNRVVAQFDTTWFVVCLSGICFVVFRYSYLDHRILGWCPYFFCFLYSSVDSWYCISFLITYGARLQDTLNMRLSRNSSGLLCQKERACSHVPDLTDVVTHFLLTEEQLKLIIIIIIRWTHSSCEDDDIKKFFKRRFTLSSYKHARHQSRNKSRDRFFHQRKARSSSSTSFLMTLNDSKWG